MNFINTNVAKTAALALALSCLLAPAAQAASGTITFKGEIVQSTCDVSTASVDQTVTIGTFPTTLFKEAGDVSAPKSFKIDMENCEAGTYTLRFDGTTPAGHPELLAVSKATGVGIEILDNNDKVFPINQDLVDPALVTVAATGKASVNLKARYKSFEKDVGAGIADANSTFSIEYR
ncbi:fimbrial protein [uncultured Stenotrophomonas sp.]|uniref:fimbrial protein n=1 Tax=uncultured Stenotrophomonas sp. TaxID=165438 RepID=UPI0025CFE7F1|nr:fimbrial protein [uncultured Stenotrophomonas sp.]